MTPVEAPHHSPSAVEEQQHHFDQLAELALFSEVQTKFKKRPTPSQNYNLHTAEPHTDPEKLAAAIIIDGLDHATLPFTISEADLKRELAIAIPPAALKEVPIISFELTDDSKQIGCGLLGGIEYGDAPGESIVIVHDEEIMASFEDMIGHNTLPEVAREIAFHQFFMTVSHEFGHAFHDALPVAILQRWLERIANDEVAVSRYVKPAKEDYFREDFSESFALFVCQPQALEHLSPTRFDAMREIFEEFQPDYAQRLAPWQAEQIAYAKAQRAAGMPDHRYEILYDEFERPVLEAMKPATKTM